MIPYITFREDVGNETAYFILQKEFPHFVCCISETPVINFIQPIPITDHNLWIVFSATLRGNFIPSYKDVGEEIRIVMNDMMNWFFENRILVNPKKYKKWKIL